jgi:hypothetical protein
MCYFRKKLERRTFSQDRYYILIKRQREGKATFNELTELDEIVNRVPDIRQIVIRENFGDDADERETPSSNDPINQNPIKTQSIHDHGLWSKIRSFINRLFASSITVTEEENLAPLF